MDNNLDKLALKYGTDKSSASHNYTPFYESILGHLKNQPVNLLEIGVRQGWSHQMWREYFLSGNIYGIDNCLESEFNSDHNHLIKKNITIFYGNQEDKDFLDKNVTHINYDIIIDDGGHKMKEQQLSLLYLIDYIKSGGFYFIEDLHTCSSPFYYENGIYPKDSTITFLYNLMNDKKVPTSFLTYNDICHIQNKISKIYFLKDNLVLLNIK